ncbi:hypothetical protein B0H13DRAFT_2306626 [Mycena leptocephala]|nr:hypothetical protein B0H13DRAFT_2306626 [Mycena leptocephala]
MRHQGGGQYDFWHMSRVTRALEFVNAKQQYKCNGIRGFVEAKLQTDACQAFMRKTAREVQEENRPQKRRLEQAKADEDTVIAHSEKRQKLDDKKKAEQKRIDEYQPMFDIGVFRDPELVKGVHVPKIDLQLKWHPSREMEIGEKTQIPAFSHLSKTGKVELLITALERWNARVAAGESFQNGPVAIRSASQEEEPIKDELQEYDIGYGDTAVCICS